MCMYMCVYVYVYVCVTVYVCLYTAFTVHVFHVAIIVNVGTVGGRIFFNETTYDVAENAGSVKLVLVLSNPLVGLSLMCRHNF